MRTCSATLILSLLLVGSVQAQLPLVHLDRIYPMGGAPGSQVAVEIGGRDLDEVKRLWFDHPGFKADFVEANKFKITIAADVPPGTYEVRAVGKHGISGSRLFAVGRGLTEVLEVKPNDAPDKPQAVPLDVVVNGNSLANGYSHFRFSAKKGQRITIEVQAFRLDSLLRPILTLFAPDGRLLARSQPYFHRIDPLIDFQVPMDGDYVLRLNDATFQGDLPYRLIISRLPWIETAFPPAVEPGKPVALTLWGRNLPGDPPQERLQVLWTAPAPTAWNRLSFIEHPASCAWNTRSLQCWPPGITNALHPISLVPADRPVTLEHEPNDTPETAQALNLPALVCGRFDKPFDIDYYSFTAKVGEQVAVDLVCERMGCPGDPLVVILDANGNKVAKFDDQGITSRGLTQLNRDPNGVFGIPADGTYRVMVQERTGKGGTRFQYVLRLGPPEPDFYPVVYHETENDPTCPQVRQKGAAVYELCLNRRDGFAAPVTIEADGLPKGLSCPPIHLGPQVDIAALVLTAAPDAPLGPSTIRLKAWSEINGKRVERSVGCVQRRFTGDGSKSASRASREICLAIGSPAPYRLSVPGSPISVKAGATAEVKVTVERCWADFHDKVGINGFNLPPGFEVTPAEIPEGKSETTVKINLTAEVPPSTYSVVLRGDASVPYQPDPAGAKMPVRVSDPAPPVTVVVTAPPKPEEGK
jgi:hypothetical protein